jgi:hypothetical protein
LVQGFDLAREHVNECHDLSLGLRQATWNIGGGENAFPVEEVTASKRTG